MTEQYLTHPFSDAELLELSRELARAEQSLSEAEDRKKTTTAMANQEIASLRAQIGVLSGKVNSGYEMRPVPCTWRLDDPRPGVKSLYRDDTGAVVQAGVAMTAEELQRALPFADGDGAAFPQGEALEPSKFTGPKRPRRKSLVPDPL